MGNEDEWDLVRGRAASPFGVAGMGLVRISLLFGSAAVALALISAPYLEKIGRYEIASAGIGLDSISTGAIADSRNYTLRRSVLQPSPNSVCVIRDNGSRSGEC